MDDIIYKSAAALARMIRMKEVSAEEVTRAHLTRIEAVNPKLNAVVQLDAEAALQRARAADSALAKGSVWGPLHGLPITIKDSLDTAGMISTGGTEGRRAYIPPQDATVVQRLRDAGAIIMGKTNTPELTLSYETDNLIYGPTSNPYDLERSPGGSSGGAAAIIAAGGSPLDMGSDTGGSIRLPAHVCGIAGIKPTFGRVPRTGHIISFDVGALDPWTQIGPMARYVEDLVMALPMIAGPDWRDPAIIPMPLGDPKRVSLKSLRVAFHTDNGIMTPTPEIAGAVRSAAQALADGGAAVDEARPDGMAETLQLMVGLELADGGAWVRRLLRLAGTEKMHPNLEGFISRAEDPKGSVASELHTRWNLMRSTMLAFMEHYDVLLCPPNALPALPKGTPFREEIGKAFTYTMTYNLTGWPGAVVRAGTSPEGLPIGVQIVARPWHEEVALAVALHIEKALGGYQRPPI